MFRRRCRTVVVAAAVVARLLLSLRRQLSDAMHNRWLDVAILACYVAALAVLFVQDHRRDNQARRVQDQIVLTNRQTIMCTNAAIAYILDVRIRLDLKRNTEVGRETALAYNQVKQKLLTPRWCPAINTLAPG